MSNEERFLRAMADNGDGAAHWAVEEIERLRMFYESSQEALAELIKDHTACQEALAMGPDRGV